LAERKSQTAYGVSGLILCEDGLYENNVYQNRYGNAARARKDTNHVFAAPKSRQEEERTREKCGH